MRKSGIGIEGEEHITRYLEDGGYRILARNFIGRFGEIDIIAQKDKYICFVEVKTRKINSMITGFESVTALKQNKIRKTAEYYIAVNKNIFDGADCQPRFDCAEVSVSENGEFCGIRYIENAF